MKSHHKFTIIEIDNGWLVESTTREYNHNNEPINTYHPKLIDALEHLNRCYVTPYVKLEKDN